MAYSFKRKMHIIITLFKKLNKVMMITYRIHIFILLTHILKDGNSKFSEMI